MKKFFHFCIFCVLVFWVHSTFAYNLSAKDQKILNAAIEKIESFEETKSQKWFETRIAKLNTLLPKLRKNLRYWTFFGTLKGSFESTLEKKLSQASQAQALLEKNEEKIENTTLSTNDFFNKYGQEIVGSLEVPQKCRDKYDFVDAIAKDEDFPTALILATWGIETNCNMYNPANGWGLFQITSQYRAPGEVGLIELEEQVRNFIAFSRNKWNYFNTNTYHNYKQRFWEENINLYYDYYTIRDLRIHAILYNGVSSTTTLEGNTFANGNLNPNVITASDGVVTRFLKILNWRNSVQ